MGIALLFLVIALVNYFIIALPDQGCIILGMVFLVIGGILYFIRGKQKQQLPDEMSKKIGTVAIAISAQIMLVVAAILYLVHTWRMALPLSLNDLFTLFIVGTLFLQLAFQRWYTKRPEKLPF